LTQSDTEIARNASTFLTATSNDLHTIDLRLRVSLAMSALMLRGLGSIGGVGGGTFSSPVCIFNRF
jgi:hypothetical protein